MAWETVTVAAVAALSALAGGITSGWVQLKIMREQHHASTRQEVIDLQRAALAELFQIHQQALAIAEGAVLSGQRTTSIQETAKQASRSVGHARLLVPPEIWAQIEPYTRAVALKVNGIQADPIKGNHWAREMLEELQAIGGDSEEAWERREIQAITAAQQLLNGL